jgi:hypothetical protein
MQQILQRAGEPIQLPDHYHVTRPEVVQQTLKLRPVPPAAGGFLLEQARASGSAECGALLCEILAFTRDAAVA